MVTKRCLTCDNEFQTYRASQHYCSRSCIPWKVLHHVKGRTQKTCVVCGTPFEVDHSHQAQRACSVKCRGISRTITERAALQTRRCLVCQKEFLIAKSGKRYSRHAKTTSQIFCSRQCRSLTRYRTGAKCFALSNEQAAYLAGFWDGEGSIMLIGRNSLMGRQFNSFGLRITTTNTCYDVLAWIQEICGIGSVQRKPRKEQHHKPTWFWQIHGEGAETFLQQLLPYLRVKREQARLALAFQVRLRDPIMKADRSWQEDWRQQMKALNARGVPDEYST